MKRPTESHSRRDDNHQHPPEDPFDHWLHLVADIVVEPILDLLRIAYGMIRGVWVRPRSARRGDSPADGHRRGRNGGDT